MKKHSFTLVEMLMVTAIIAVLAGFLMPAVGQARATAKRTSCLSNQGQTMKIVAQAMNDNQQFLVSGDKFDISSNTNTKNASWTRYLFGEGDVSSGNVMYGKKSYLQNMSAFRCPGFHYDVTRDLGALNNDDAREKQLEMAYGMMYSKKVEDDFGFAGFDFRGTKYIRFSKTNDDNSTSSYQISPGSLILGGCASVTSKPYDEAKALLCSGNTSNTNTSSGDWKGRFVKIHSDLVNTFFLDGHADSLSLGGINDRYFPDAEMKRAKKFDDSDEDNFWIDPDKK